MEIKITHGLDHFEDPFYVRTEVFVKEQKFENEKDDIDDFCTHFTGYIKDIPVASGRCYNQDKNTMAIGRIAVIKEYRSYHLGSEMLQAIEKHCQSLNILRLTLSAQCQAIGFYEKCGYHKIGDVYMDEHCPHQQMVKFIKKTPQIKCLISDLDGTLLKIGNELSKGISEENKTAVKRFIQNGNIFAAASSRGIDSKEEIEALLNEKIDFIGCTGGEISIQNKLVYSQLTNLSDLAQLNQIVQESKLDAAIMFFREDKKETWLSDLDHYPYVLSRPSIRKRETWDHPHVIVNYDDIKKWKVHKFFVFVHPEDMLALRTLVKEKFQGKYEVNSCDLDLIEILPKNVSKANGIRQFARYQNLTMNQIAAIGDSDNDVSMLEACEVSFCMDHTEKAVQDKATFIVKSVREAIELLEIMNR